MYGSRSTPYPSFKVRIQESSFESAIVGKTFCGPMARHLERWVSSSILLPSYVEEGDLNLVCLKLSCWNCCWLVYQPSLFGVPYG